MAAGTGHTLAAEESVSAVCPLLFAFGVSKSTGASVPLAACPRSSIAHLLHSSQRLRRTSSLFVFRLGVDCSIPFRCHFSKRDEAFISFETSDRATI